MSKGFHYEALHNTHELKIFWRSRIVLANTTIQLKLTSVNTEANTAKKHSYHIVYGIFQNKSIMVMGNYAWHDIEDETGIQYKTS